MSENGRIMNPFDKPLKLISMLRDEVAKQSPKHTAQFIGHSEKMSKSPQAGGEETHLGPASVEIHNAGSSQLSATPQEAFEQLPPAAQSEINDYNEQIMSNSAETGLEETHLDPVSVETPTAGSSQLSVTPQEAFEQLPAAVQAEVKQWMARYSLSAHIARDREDPFYTATFTRADPVLPPASKNQMSESPASSRSPDTVTIQRVITTGESSVTNVSKDKFTLVKMVFPDLQPLAWKTSAPSNREFTFMDELIHRPDAQTLGLQNQAWRIFHDQRRNDLVNQYLPVFRENQGTHLAAMGDLVLYMFDVGRPQRIWTVGGYGSEEVGFAKDQKSAIGECMFNYDEADIILLTEAEHVIWAAHAKNSTKNVVISDKEFNRRRPAKSTNIFLEQCKRKAASQDILIDVQKLDRPKVESAGVQMNLRDAMREFEKSRNDAPISIQNPPLNLLNITDQSRGQWTEGMTKSYTLMDELIEFVDTKVYQDLDDVKGNSAVGKPIAVVKHHSDMQKCGQFRILAQRGAVSLWHIDQCGVNTFIHAEGNTNDPDEKDEDVVKYWPSYPMGHLTPEGQKEAWAEYARDGENWRPRLKEGIPVLTILKGWMLIQAPGNIHAPITLTDCFFLGGMAWKDSTLQKHLDSWKFTAENPGCTNEDVPRQSQEYLSYLVNMVNAQPQRFGYPSNSEADLEQFNNAVTVIYSSVTNCECKGLCAKSKSCACTAINVKCGQFCHTNKVLDFKKPCHSWVDRLQKINDDDSEHEAPAPKKRSIINGRQKKLLEQQKASAQENDESAELEPMAGGKRRHADSHVPAPRQRQRREEFEAPAPGPKLSAKQKTRVGKPCTNCDRSGLGTHYRGPTGNTLCSNCNNKWRADGAPAIWGSMMVADASAAETPAPKAPVAKAPVAAGVKRKRSLDSDFTSSSPRPAPSRVLSPQSAGENLFKAPVANPFRQSNMSIPREGMTSPTAAPAMAKESRSEQSAAVTKTATPIAEMVSWAPTPLVAKENQPSAANATTTTPIQDVVPRTSSVFGGSTLAQQVEDLNKLMSTGNSDSKPTLKLAGHIGKVVKPSFEGPLDEESDNKHPSAPSETSSLAELLAKPHSASATGGSIFGSILSTPDPAPAAGSSVSDSILAAPKTAPAIGSSCFSVPLDKSQVLPAPVALKPAPAPSFDFFKDQQKVLSRFATLVPKPPAPPSNGPKPCAQCKSLDSGPEGWKEKRVGFETQLVCSKCLDVTLLPAVKPASATGPQILKTPLDQQEAPSATSTPKPAPLNDSNLFNASFGPGNGQSGSVLPSPKQAAAIGSNIFSDPVRPSHRLSGTAIPSPNPAPAIDRDFSKVSDQQKTQSTAPAQNPSVRKGTQPCFVCKSTKSGPMGWKRQRFGFATQMVCSVCFEAELPTAVQYPLEDYYGRRPSADSAMSSSAPSAAFSQRRSVDLNATGTKTAPVSSSASSIAATESRPT